MPIETLENQSPPVRFPQSNYRIVKYLDLTKFISLLQTQSFFFCRLDKLEDHFEGTTAKANYEYRKNWYTQLYEDGFFNDAYTEKKVIEKVENDYNYEQKIKKLNTVCCWNKNKTESAALWKIYSDFHKGIMISTSIEKLIKSFRETPESIFLSEVKYIDYNKDRMPDGNTIFPIIHKHIAYSFEEEVRMIYEVDHKGTWDYDWSQSDIEQGKYLKVKLNDLIDEIIISPYSPNWYLDLVQNLVNKYDLNKKVKKSELSQNGT